MQIKTGTELVVWMKHGPWWSEIKRGTPITVTKGGDGECEFRETLDIMRTNDLRATVAPAKDGRVKLTLVGGVRVKRALTCSFKVQP